MGQDSSIQWTTHTFNPWRGCTKVSAGCANCYAETLAKRNPKVLGVWGDQGTRVVASESTWDEPLKWDKAAREAGERHRVFCASLADVFEDWDGPVVSSKGNPFWWCFGSLSNSPIPSTGLPSGCRMATMEDIRYRLFDLISETPNLDWLLLTKRPENLENMLPWTSAHAGEYRERYWDNVWIGTTVENQEQADKRIPQLLQVPAKVRFLSMEPQLEEIDLSKWLDKGIHWVIQGGESGARARTFNLAWSRKTRDQCKKAGVAYFFKQAGSKPYDSFYLTDQRVHLKDSHGGDPSEWPEDLRVRQFPEVQH